MLQQFIDLNHLKTFIMQKYKYNIKYIYLELRFIFLIVISISNMKMFLLYFLFVVDNYENKFILFMMKSGLI